MVPFSQEFKDQIVELHRKGGRTFIDLAREFNLSATSVSNWVRPIRSWPVAPTHPPQCSYAN